MSVNSKLVAIADEIRELSGTAEPMGLDAMASNLGEANDEVASQEDLIADIVAALEGKATGGSEAKLPTLINPAAEDEIFLNKEVIDKDGNKLTGSFTIDNELSVQNDIISQIQSAVNNLPEAGGSVGTAGSCTVTITFNSNCTESLSFIGEGEYVPIVYVDSLYTLQTLMGIISFNDPIIVPNVLCNSVLIMDTYLCDSDCQLEFSFSGDTTPTTMAHYAHAAFFITENNTNIDVHY